MKLDPDELIALARTDPRAFEQRRLQLIEEVISAAPETQRARLRGLQFRIDLERQRAVTALGACVKLNTMMWDSFVVLRDGLSQLANQGLARPKANGARSARVIPFVTSPPKPPNDR